jgi:hypothetical protein
MKHVSGFVGALAVLAMASTGADAASPSTGNDATMICAVVDLASCVPGDGCRRETSESINAPQLLTIDQKDHIITARRPDGATLSTTIDRTTRSQGLTVLDGVQNELSWTVTISDNSGAFSLAAIGDGQAYTAFGSCEPK